MKAQASLEFVTTYSWAIAVVLIMIGAVVYLGVFDSNVFLRPYCELSKEMVCQDYSLTTGTVNIKVANNFERDIDIHNMTISSGNNVETCTFAPIVVGMGKTADLTCSWPTAVLGKSDKQKVNIRIGYSRKGGSTTYTVSGALLATPI